MTFFKGNIVFIVALGVLLRFSLRFSSYYGEIAKRVEISSPVNSWRRVVEGVTLKELQISPYSGDTFHESPIFLSLYRLLLFYLSEFQIACFFILLDISTAFVLAKLCSAQLESIFRIENQRIKSNNLAQNKKDLDDETLSNLVIDHDSISVSFFWTIAIYLLSPYSMLSCVAQATSVISNFLISLTLLSATNGFRICSLFLLALLSLNSFYPLILLPTIILFHEQKYRFDQVNEKSKKSKPSGPNLFEIDLKLSSTKLSIASSLLLFIFFYVALFYASFIIENQSLQFLQSTYIFTWSVSDLTPNIGLFWYFFTEMFDHFREFFLWVFQINFFIYIIPLTCNFRANPYFISMISLIIHSLFKPYPTVSDFALYLALLPQWSHLFQNMKSILVISCTIVTCTVLAPILWYLWIILGTANSNFYFGVTLAYNVAQIFLATDLMFSFVKREFYINNLHLYRVCKKANKAPKIELSF